MLKTKIIVAAASVLIIGVGAGTGAYIATRDNAPATSEVSSVANKIESVDTSPIEAVVSAGIEQIESATSAALQQIESKAAEKILSASTEIKVQIPSEVSLNVETKRGDGTLTFQKVKLSTEFDELVILYITSDLQSHYPNTDRTKLITKSGKEYVAAGMGGAGSNGSITFQNITDYSDLSTVTLTYAFEGFDPVTVTFDIPME